jgi:3-hydroxy acid dehydrogenase/malonic semialdehyde reductase
MPPETQTSSRHVLVTGASSGIGEAISKRLTDAGHQVTGLARDFDKSSLRTVRFHPVSMDFARIDSLPDQLKTLHQELSPINAIVCCAGRGQFGSLEEFSYEQIRSLMELNFLSQAYVVRSFLPGMKQAGRGDIIIIGSEAALSGGRKGAIYCASKFALRGFAQALREECSSSGIRTTIINPGMVKTDFFTDLAFAHGDDEDNYILPEDIADTAVLVLNSRYGTVYDEINLSPQKKVIRRK